MTPRDQSAAWLLAAALLTGCNTLAPDYERPEPGAWADGPYAHARAAAAEQEPQPTPALTRWWQGLGDPQLEPLVEEALEHNFDLAVAVARIDEARAQTGVAAGNRWPRIQLTASESRTRLEAEPDNIYNSIFTPGGSISWQLDLFGRLRSSQYAAKANLRANELDALALKHSLAAEVVRARVDLATLQRRIALAEAIRSSRQRTVESVERRFAAGVAGTGAVAVHLAHENLSSAEANLPALQQQLEARALALDILLGRQPGSSAASDRPQLAALPPGERPPTGVPAALLDRRPDLLASEFRAIAANFGIGAALADMLPDLTLSAQASRGINAAGGAFQIDGWIANVTGSLAYTLFQGGALQAATEAQEARTRAALATYSGLVQRAVGEVEDALIREQRLFEQQERVRDQNRSARAAEDGARTRYEAGLESLLVLLETERRRAQSDDLLAQLEGASWNARIDLILALGGDWLPEPEESNEQASDRSAS